MGTRDRGSFWPGLVVGLLLLNAGVVAVTVRAALGGPRQGVEPGYDAKARAWDAEIAQRQRNARLGWNADLSIGGWSSSGRGLSLRLSDRTGAPIDDAKVTIEAFHNAASARRLVVELERLGPGVYRGSAALARPGLWDVRLRASRGVETFTAEFEREIEGAGA